MKHLFSLLILGVVLSACGDGAGGPGGSAPAAETAGTANLPQGEYPLSNVAYWTTIDGGKFFAIVFQGGDTTSVSYNMVQCKIDREFTHTGFNTYRLKLFGSAKYSSNPVGVTFNCGMAEGTFAVTLTGPGFEDITVVRVL